MGAMTPTQDLQYTLVALAFCAGLGILSFRRNFARHDEFKPRMVPWMIIALACLATNFMLIVHLVNLAGFETGR